VVGDPSATISRGFSERALHGAEVRLVFAATFYAAAGTFHFVRTEAYLRIMPPFVPWHLLMVRISGCLEILGGLGLLVLKTRRAAAWGLVALLIAVFPANIYMATNPVEAGAASIAPLFRWARLPLQLLLICGCSGALGLVNGSAPLPEDDSHLRVGAVRDPVPATDWVRSMAAAAHSLAD